MSAVTLLGRGPSWTECPETTSELWGTASCLITPGLSDKKYDKVFVFDDNDIALKLAAIAKERNIPLVSPCSFATEFWPARLLVRKLRSAYFLSTMTRMIAYALYLDYTKICIYGIDQGPDWGVMQARNHTAHWIGIAIGRGVDVRMGRGSMAWTYRIPPKPDTEAIKIPDELTIYRALEIK